MNTTPTNTITDDGISNYDNNNNDASINITNYGFLSKYGKKISDIFVHLVIQVLNIGI